MDFKIDSLSNASEFLKVASSLLYDREAEFSLLLGLCELQVQAKNPSDTYKYFCLFGSEKLIGTAMLNERRLVISNFSESSLNFLVSYLAKQQLSIPGVVGPSITAKNFAQAWSSITNKKNNLAMGQKIYQLTQVSMPTNFVGALTLAQEADIQLVGQWLLEFSIESLPHQPTSLEKMIELAKVKIQKQEAYLWLDKNNRPVSMNLVGRPTKNGISVSGVYTHKDLRKNGFASALVANTSQKMLDNGKKFCVLYTDNANPTSNKIYQQVGYKKVATSKDFIFES